MAEEKHEGLRQAVRAFAVLGGMGIYFVVFVGICGFIGYLVDDCYNLGNIGKLIGFIVGFPAAIYSLYRQLRGGNLL